MEVDLLLVPVAVNLKISFPIIILSVTERVPAL